MKIQLRQDAKDATEALPNGFELVEYFEQGRQPGGFIGAVLANDLKRAASMADSRNASLLFEYGKWLYNYAPLGFYGSREAIVKHLENIE